MLLISKKNEEKERKILKEVVMVGCVSIMAEPATGDRVALRWVLNAFTWKRHGASSITSSQTPLTTLINTWLHSSRRTRRRDSSRVRGCLPVWSKCNPIREA